MLRTLLRPGFLWAFVVAASYSLLLATESQAELIAVEHFLGTTYTNNYTIEGVNGGTGFAAWMGVSSDGIQAFLYDDNSNLTYSGVSSSGGSIVAGSASSPNVNERVISAASSIHDRLYFSFLLEAAAPTADYTLAQVRRASAGDGVININSKSGKWELGLENGGQNLKASTGVDITPNQTAMVVGRIDFNVGGTGGTAETVSLFINPTSSIEPTTPNATIGATNNISIDDGSPYELFLRLSQNPFATLRVDEIAFGRNFSDFFTQTTATPEPATWLTGTLAAAALLTWHRRRRVL